MANAGVMSTMNISLPDGLKSFVDEQVSQRDYGASSEYVKAPKRALKIEGRGEGQTRHSARAGQPEGRTAALGFKDALE